ncbi:hypothetical protein GGR52DRAFT_567907 [Hypoxylon sp. FL1284]|nr:hypothetical protein GGR52DRAFT_567907 [Hypoxylon sp. FL1284]
MLQRPRDLLTTHDPNPSSSVSRHCRSYCHPQHQLDLSHGLVVAPLQLVPNNQVNSFNSPDSAWNATRAELVARWEKINNTRGLHRFKRGMVKKLALLKNSVTKSQPPGSTSADGPQRRIARAVSRPERAQAEGPLVVGDLNGSSEQCLAKLGIRTEYYKLNNGRYKPGDLSMESKRKAGAAQRPGHRQLDHVDTYEASEASGNSDSGSGATGSGDNNSEQGQSSRSSRTKRRLGGDDQDNSSAGGDEGGPDRGGNKRAKTDNEPERKFACPFFKHDAKTHSKHRSCTGPGWTSLHRLKEHLYRVHRLPKHTCPRCNGPFEDAKDLAEHLRADVPCEKLEVVPSLQGIDESIEAELRVRKKNCPGMTDEQRWKDIYMILFPKANPKALPSPYSDHNDALGSTERAEEWRRAKKRIQKELPKFVQKKVERRFEKVGAEILNGLPDIVRDGLLELFESSPRDEQSPTVTPAATPRAPTPSFSAASDQLPVNSDDINVSWLDHPLFESGNQYFLGEMNELDFAPFDFGSSAEYIDDKGSDSGYASTGTRDFLVGNET